MTDIVEQAARVMAGGEEYADGYMRLAQALADAGLLAEPARTVPTRGEIAEVLTYALTGAGVDDYREYSGEEGLRAYYRMADAVLELLADQPTVAEVQAQALEEAADDLEADLGTTGPGNRRTGYGTVALDLLRLIRNRAQQIRDGQHRPAVEPRPATPEMRVEWRPKPRTAPDETNIEVSATCRKCGTVTTVGIIARHGAIPRFPQALLKCDCQRTRRPNE